MVVLAMCAAAAVGAVVGAVAGRQARRAIAGQSPARREARVRRELRIHPRVAEFLRRRLRPEAWTGLLLTAVLLATAVAAAIVGGLLAMVYRGAGLARADLPWAEWAAERSTDTQTDMLRFVSTWGGTTVVLGLAVMVAVIEFARRRTPEVFAYVAVTVLGQFVASNLIKVIVDRARPEVMQLSGHSGASFPSGHATAAAASFACFAFLLGLGRSGAVKTSLAAAAGAIAFAVAATRVLLGVHWVTDVVAGVVVGWFWFALCTLAFGGRMLRFGRPVEMAEQVARGERPVAHPTGP